jgi:hypothetical protein
MTMTAQAYRANAKQCLSWAESATDPENREAFFALAATWESAAADREIDRPAGDQSNRRTFAPSGGRGLTVPVGPALCDERRQVGDVGGDPPRLIAFLFAIREAAHVDRVAGQQ